MEQSATPPWKQNLVGLTVTIVCARPGAPAQNISFKPNWICLGVVAKVVITPADELIAPLENTVALGVPKFTRFVMLKNSVRNCNAERSVMRVFLNTEKSSSPSPGPE